MSARTSRAPAADPPSERFQLNWPIHDLCMRLHGSEELLWRLREGQAAEAPPVFVRNHTHTQSAQLRRTQAPLLGSIFALEIYGNLGAELS